MYGHAHLLADPGNHCAVDRCRRLATAVTDDGHRICARCALTAERRAV